MIYNKFVKAAPILWAIQGLFSCIARMFNRIMNLFNFFIFNN